MERNLFLLFAFCLSLVACGQIKGKQALTGLTINPDIKVDVEKHIETAKELDVFKDKMAVYVNTGEIQSYENDSLVIDSKFGQYKSPFKSFYLWSNDTLSINGAFGLFGGVGFVIKITNDTARLYHMLSSDDYPTYTYHKNDVLIYRLEVPCTDTKIVLSEIPDSTKKQVIYGYINGQQTTRTLSLSGRSEAEVLVKLIEIPRDNDQHNNQYRHLVSEIVSATNWQNAISQSDLKSNDAEQVRIEKEFKKLNYFYIRKRMSRSEAVKYGADKYRFKINKEQLARASAACILDPYEVRLGKDRLFEDDVYSQVFDGRKASEYLLVYWLFKDVEFWSKGTNKYAYAKWHVLNLLWNLLGADLKKISCRDQFRVMAERRRFYVRELEPLDKIVKIAFRFSTSFMQHIKELMGKFRSQSTSSSIEICISS
jgi:hypothetical protein